MKEALVLQCTVSWGGIRRSVSLWLTLLVSRHPCHWRQWRCSCTTGEKTSSWALQLLLPTKASPERKLAETPLAHTPYLNFGLHLNGHREESSGSMTLLIWGISFSELEGECQKVSLHVSTHRFSLCDGSAGVQALQIPRRWFQSSECFSNP